VSASKFPPFLFIASLSLHATIGGVLFHILSSHDAHLSKPVFDVSRREDSPPDTHADAKVPAAPKPPGIANRKSSEDRVSGSSSLNASIQSAPAQYPPVPSSGQSLADYTAELRARIESRLRYPLSLRRRGISGRVGLKLVINLKLEAPETPGAFTVEISEPSPHAELNEFALEAARAASPYPLPNGELKKMGKLVLSLPIEFKLQ
jgi:outer membrane biosynthesis protein TonB